MESLGIDHLSRVKLIARGGSGEVYSAFRDTHGDPVAVKVLTVVGAADDSGLGPFARELESLEQLGEVPGVVAALDSGISAHGRPYLIMPLMPGGSGADRLTDGGLDWREAAEVLVPVARAVQAAHDVGVWHRDLKPANILFSRHGAPFVADFGIAKLLDTAGTIENACTPNYAAPEALEGRHVQASDVYGLGATLAAFLTGHAPFSAPGQGLLATMQRVATEAPPDLQSEECPAELAGLVTLAMAKDPNARPATPGRFADLLAGILERNSPDGESVPQTGPPEPAPTPEPTAEQAPDEPVPLLPAIKPPRQRTRASSRRIRALAAVVAVIGGFVAVWLLASEPVDTTEVLAQSVDAPEAEGDAPTDPGGGSSNVAAADGRPGRADDGSAAVAALTPTVTPEPTATSEPTAIPVPRAATSRAEEPVGTRPSPTPRPSPTATPTPEPWSPIVRCSTDIGPTIGVRDRFKFTATVQPADTDISFRFDHGDGTGEFVELSGYYRDAGNYQARVLYDAVGPDGEQVSGEAPCADFTVLAGWTVCPVEWRPVQGRLYDILQTNEVGLRVRVAPGVGSGLSPTISSYWEGDRVRFSECLQQGTSRWWRSEAGWSSVIAIDHGVTPAPPSTSSSAEPAPSQPASSSAGDCPPVWDLAPGQPLCVVNAVNGNQCPQGIRDFRGNQAVCILNPGYCPFSLEVTGVCRSGR